MITLPAPRAVYLKTALAALTHVAGMPDNAPVSEVVDHLNVAVSRIADVYRTLGITPPRMDWMTKAPEG